MTRPSDEIVQRGSAAPGRDASRIGPYRVLRRLGRGGQGEVHLAVDERDGTRVALKVLAAGAGSEAARAALRREAEAGARVDHPSLCFVRDAGCAGGREWIATRYVEGETLAQRIDAARASRSKIPWREALRWIEACARGLHEAHRAFLIHRDVKPSNVMISSAGDAVVLDFGLACVVDDEAPTPRELMPRTDPLAGSPAYMAPERIAGGRIDRRIDVYALGAILYEALTLRRPFVAPTREALFRAILHDAPRPLRRLAPDVPRELETVVATALQREVDRRYATALDFAAELRRVARGERVHARPRRAGSRLVAWMRRERAAAALIVVLAAAAAYACHEHRRLALELEAVRGSLAAPALDPEPPAGR